MIDNKFMKVKYYIGLDIGGTKCATTLAQIDDEPNILSKESFATEGRSPEETLSLFAKFIRKHEKKSLSGIGISCGGPLDSKRGVIMSPPSLADWKDIPVVDYFRKEFHVPVYLQNDANACAVAEWKFGAGKGTSNMVFLTFGTGLGAGLILNGKLYSGANDNAGEIGHVRLTDEGPYGYYKYGSCEGYCSGGGIARLAQLMRNRRRGETVGQDTEQAESERLTAKELAERARQGDEFALSVFRESGKMFGRTLSILVDLINPEKIIVGGVFMRAGDLLFAEADKVMRQECLSYSYHAVSVEPAGLGENVGDYAALAVARGDF